MVCINAHFDFLLSLLSMGLDEKASQWTPDFHGGSQSFRCFRFGGVGQKTISRAKHALCDEGKVEPFSNIVVQLGFEV